MYQSFPHDHYNAYYYTNMNTSQDECHSPEFRARSQTWGGNEIGYRSRHQEVSPTQQYSCRLDSVTSKDESLNSLQDYEISDEKLESQPKSSVSKKTSRKNPWGQETYADLIERAINSYPNKMATLQQIYDYIAKNYKYFLERSDAASSAGWKNSIRHNLSLHDKFLKCPKKNENMKSSLWSINQNCIKRARSNSMECKKNTLDIMVKRRLVKEQRRTSATNSSHISESKRSMTNIDKNSKSDLASIAPSSKPQTLRENSPEFLDMETELKYMPPEIPASTLTTSRENNLHEDLQKLGMSSMEPIYTLDEDSFNYGRSDIPDFHIAAMEYSKFVAELFLDEIE